MGKYTRGEGYEIYARHGYIFQDKDLYNYFMGCIWYSPTTEPEDFADSVFNEYEKANLELLVELDHFPGLCPAANPHYIPLEAA